MEKCEFSYPAVCRNRLTEPVFIQLAHKTAEQITFPFVHSCLYSEGAVHEGLAVADDQSLAVLGPVNNVSRHRHHVNQPLNEVDDSAPVSSSRSRRLAAALLPLCVKTCANYDHECII